MTKHLNITTILWLALALALLGSLRHLAAMFASIDGNYLYGWFQAVAIDAGLFALAYSVKSRRADKRPTKILWLGLSLFVVISIYGNLAYGIMSTGGHLPDWISVSRPWVLAASLPVLVLFLSELLSDDKQFAEAKAEREAKRQTKRAPSAFEPVKTESPDKPDNGKSSKVDIRRAQVWPIVRQINGNLSNEDKKNIAARFGVSVKTVDRDIEAMPVNGRGTK